MNLQTRFKKAMLLGCALLVTTFVTQFALAADDQYSFKVKNTTDELITKILVSEDGEKYGYFDIGSGIKPGDTVTLVWDKSTATPVSSYTVLRSSAWVRRGLPGTLAR